jgi:hypothetical protein
MKPIPLIVMLLVTQYACSQTQHKETLFGVHPITVQLKPNVTMEQFKTFFVNEVLSEYEKHWVGLKGYLVKSVRGDHKDHYAIVWVFDTEKARDGYFNADGTPNDLEKVAFEKVKPIEEKLARYGTYTIDYKDDWVVQ